MLCDILLLFLQLSRSLFFQINCTYVLKFKIAKNCSNYLSKIVNYQNCKSDPMYLCTYLEVASSGWYGFKKLRSWRNFSFWSWKFTTSPLPVFKFITKADRCKFLARGIESALCSRSATSSYIHRTKIVCCACLWSTYTVTYDTIENDLIFCYNFKIECVLKTRKFALRI
jgi:hypothetical protein